MSCIDTTPLQIGTCPPYANHADVVEALEIGRTICARAAWNHNSNLSVPNGSSWTIVPILAVTQDTHSIVDIANNRIFTSIRGVWAINAWGSFAANGTGARGIRLLRDGSATIGVNVLQAPPTVACQMLCSVITRGGPSNSFRFEVQQLSGGSLNFSSFFASAFLLSRE